LVVEIDGHPVFGILEKDLGRGHIVGAPADLEIRGLIGPQTQKKKPRTQGEEENGFQFPGDGTLSRRRDLGSKLHIQAVTARIFSNRGSMIIYKQPFSKNLYFAIFNLPFQIPTCPG
jgi:hypothetical protein